MKIINSTVLLCIFLWACNAPNKNEQNNSANENELDIKALRNLYMSNYNTVEKLDTTFTDNGGNKIIILSKYYCLLDSAIKIPAQYVFEENPKDFITHNYAQNITITKGRNIIFNKTITKKDFENLLSDELKNYAVLMFPTFQYLKKDRVFDFRYSLSIPMTDIGEGLHLLIDEKGDFKIVEKVND